MKTILLILTSMALAGVHAELVSLRVSVVDYEGAPVEGATVSLATAEKRIVPYAKTDYKEWTCKTDAKGFTRDSFLCWDGRIFCNVSADGYYSEEISDVSFKTNYDRKRGVTIFLEKEKDIKVKLRPQKHPQSQIRHRILKGNVRCPEASGVFGYDLEFGDWVKPFGDGEVVDFSIEYMRKEDEGGGFFSGAIVFTGEGSGAYVREKLPCKLFPVDYCVDTNAIFRQRIPFVCGNVGNAGVRKDERAVGANEYMVIRSRVVLDDKGNVVKANYSQIHGPFGIGWFVAYPDAYFNPRVNDINLEYQQNLPYSKGKRPCQ